MDQNIWRDLLINFLANLATSILFLIVTPIAVYVSYKIGLQKGKGKQVPLEERFVIAVEAVELAEREYPESGTGVRCKYPWAVRYYIQKTGASEEKAESAISDAFIRTVYAKQHNKS